MANALISQIRDVIERYHVALDRREHGDIAAHNAIDEIQDHLNQPWVQGAALGRHQRGEERSTPVMMSLVCRGDWILGSACGHCERCYATAQQAIRHLQERLSLQEKKLTRIVAGMSPPSLVAGIDITDELKIAQHAYVRKILYEQLREMDR